MGSSIFTSHFIGSSDARFGFKLGMAAASLLRHLQMACRSALVSPMSATLSTPLQQLGEGASPVPVKNSTHGAMAVVTFLQAKSSGGDAGGIGTDDACIAG